MTKQSLLTYSVLAALILSSQSYAQSRQKDSAAGKKDEARSAPAPTPAPAPVSRPTPTPAPAPAPTPTHRPTVSSGSTPTPASTRTTTSTGRENSTPRVSQTLPTPQPVRSTHTNNFNKPAETPLRSSFPERNRDSVESTPSSFQPSRDIPEPENFVRDSRTGKTAKTAEQNIREKTQKTSTAIPDYTFVKRAAPLPPPILQWKAAENELVRRHELLNAKIDKNLKSIPAKNSGPASRVQLKEFTEVPGKNLSAHPPFFGSSLKPKKAGKPNFFCSPEIFYPCSPVFCWTYSFPVYVVQCYTDYVYSEVYVEEVPVGVDLASELAGLTPLERAIRLGDLYFRIGQYQKAARAYCDAIVLAPEQADLYFVLSDALFAIGDYKSAAMAIRHGLKLDPDLATSQFDKREFYSDPQEFADQLRVLERFVETHPQDQDALLVLSYNYFFSFQFVNAKVTVDRLLRAGPDLAGELFLQTLTR